MEEKFINSDCLNYFKGFKMFFLLRMSSSVYVDYTNVYLKSKLEIFFFNATHRN